MRPLVVDGAYDPQFHTLDALSPLGLGVSYYDPRHPVLVPMNERQPMGGLPSISLYDFSHGLHTAFHAAGPAEAARIVLQQLSALRSNSGHVVVCLDSKPYWRSKIHPEYKAQRRHDPELANMWDRALELVRDEGYQCAASPGQEADDVMATLAREYVAELCTDVRLVTADKDIAQCLGSFRRWFVPRLGKRDEFEMRDVDWCLKHWGDVHWEDEGKVGPTPAEIPLVLAIMGDASDHIPGVKGIGIKGAIGLVKTYGTLENMAQAANDAVKSAEVSGKKPPAFWKNYRAGMAEIPRWLQLTTLDDHVALDAHPLKYLERIEPKPLVEESEWPVDEERAAIESECMEPSDEELAAERAEMAASLPVGRYMVTHQGPVTVVENDLTPVGEPVRDPKERRAAMAAEADKVFPLPAPKAMVIGKDPGADEALRALKPSPAPIVLTDDLRHLCKSQLVYRAPEILSPYERELMRLWSLENGPGPEATTQAAHSPSGAASQPPTASPPAAAPSPSSPRSEVVPRSQGPRKQDEIPAGDIVRVAAPSWALATQPSTANEMLAIAKVLFNSRLYGQFGSERGVFAVMALGREFGMGMAESLEAFFIVNERPFPKAVWILSRAQKHPDCAWMMVTSADAKQATVTTLHRQAGKLEYQYTAERAAAAGYFDGKNKHNWITKTQEMLEARAISKATRRWYPGSVFGMHAMEEAGDD